ncbi:MAG: chromosome segregation protein SMC [Blastocatellia bacterium]
MFRLQRLEITGFKSFADHTEIVFTGNGITAVVGPNGCGKSNVADAISWVLGEQRAKSLRGAEMKDFVFQGTKNRKPSGMAEVVLHLLRDENFIDFEESELDEIDEALGEIDDLAVDVGALEGEPAAVEVAALASNGNGKKHIEPGEIEAEKVQAAAVGSIQTIERPTKVKRRWRPRSFALDFAPGEAVTITRRLYLSGESEYLLNGKACRLRDIQDLFAGTGLSGAHYAIIEQGRINQILSGKPADKRSLIEEAAGISKFRTRQRAAETRLEAAKANLHRISDIVSEVEKQANSLRRQAGKTRRFIALQEEFRELQRKYFAAESRHLEEQIKEIAEEFNAAVNAENEARRAVELAEAAAREATQRARQEEETLSELRQEFSETQRARDRAERDHRYQSEQIVELTNRAESLRGEIAAIEGKIAVANAERRRLEAEEERESAEAAEAEAVLLEAEGLFAARNDDLKAIEADLEARRAEVIRHTAAAAAFGETARQLEYNLKRLSERIEGLRREAVRAEETRQHHQTEAEKFAAELITERKKLESLNAEKAEFMREAAAARDVVRAGEDAARAIQQSYARVCHRLETLQELDEKRAVYAPAVQKLFAESETLGVKLRGVLADFLSVSAEAEKAVESLFGQYLQAVIVSETEDAVQIAEWLEKGRAGRLAIIVAGAASIGPAEMAAGPAVGRISDLLGVNAELRGLLERSFPREMSARLVEDFGREAENSEEVLVNRRGNIRLGRQLLVCGQANSDEKNESLLAFKRELAGLGEEETRLADELATAESEVVVAREQLASIEEKAVDVQSLIIKVERGILGLESQVAIAAQDIERAERHSKVVAEEIAQLTSEMGEIGKKIAEAKENAKKAAELQSSAEAALEEIALRLQQAREAAEIEAESLNRKRMLAATSSERRRSVQNAIRRLDGEQRELESRLELQRSELAETQARLRELGESLAAVSAILEAAPAEREKEQAELSAAIEKLSEARAAADRASADLADANLRSADAMNRRSAVEVRRTEAVTLLKNLQEKCVQELGIAADQIGKQTEVTDDFDLGQVREAVEEMRQRLEGFGAINMLAVEELEQAEERLLFLTSQRQDIIDSIKSAEEALREIKERSRERFLRAFEAINANFAEFFSELFGGGRGEMSLLEADDVLEAGIEVVAQPPGKRLQNIMLLSGGEKAMTAIALVMAIFKYRPSPFCLLDEVDAPLDDANVGRFVGKIAEMSEKTQFIVITHNKRTMEAAKALYGVTMQEPGVSRIVSVRFE